jgi:hypothetical protein
VKDKRKQQILRRKNFFPTLVLTILFWLTLGGLVYFVEPDACGILPVFFLVLFLALLFSFSTIFANARRGLITALGLVLFLIMRYFGVGNIINFLLILGVGISIEIYFTKLSH